MSVARRLSLPLVLVGLAVLYQVLVFATLAQDIRFGNPILDSRFQIDWALQLLEGSGHDRLFFQSPLYSYLMAAGIAVFGWSPGLFGVAQLGLSLGLGGVAYVSARLLQLGRGATWCAVTLVLLWPVFPFYAAELNKTMLEIFLTALVLLVALWAIAGGGSNDSRESRWHRYAVFPLVGLLIGMAALVRPSFLLIPFLILFFLGLRRLHVFGLLLIGFLLPVSWAVLHNTLVAGKLMSVQTSSGYNLYLGNNPYDSTGTQQEVPGTTLIPALEEAQAKSFAEQRSGRALDWAEVNAFYRGLVWDFASSQPGRFMALVGAKLWRYAHRTELPDNACFDCARREMGLLRWNPLQFSLLVWLAFPAIALIGLASPQNSRRPWWREGFDQRWFPTAYAIVLGLTVVMFFVNARVRAGHAAVWVLVVAQGLDALMRLRQSGGLNLRRRVLIGAVMLPGLFWVFARDLPESYHPDNFIAKKAVIYAELGFFPRAHAQADELVDPGVRASVHSYLNLIEEGRVTSGEYEPLLSPLIPKRRPQ